MKITINFLSASLFVLCGTIVKSQSLASGIITDLNNTQALPFSSVGLKHQLSGTISNEAGYFDFIIPADAINDTLIFGAFGYRHALVPVKSINGAMHIKLSPNPVQLDEIAVSPKPPEFYITLAMRRLKYNLPEQPFEALAYYREKVLENKNFVKMDEGVFKTYCPKYQDTTSSHDQLLLFRTVDDLHQLEFMSKERKKDEEKNKEKIAKGQKPEKQKLDIDLVGSLGGPAGVLKSTRLSAKNNNYLDTAKLKEYTYTFAKAGNNVQGNFMVIDFKSNGKVDHVRETGRIFLDPATYAIVKVENSGTLIIPVLLRPIIYMYGFGIENPTFESNVEFQKAGEHWYPRVFTEHIVADLTRRHWFSSNEHSEFNIEQAYVVNKLNIQNPNQINPANKFVSSKPMKDQVHNDEGLKWDEVNVIRK